MKGPFFIFTLNLFGNFRFGTGYFEMRYSKSYYLGNLELVGLFENTVSEHTYSYKS